MKRATQEQAERRSAGKTRLSAGAIPEIVFDAEPDACLCDQRDFLPQGRARLSLGRLPERDGQYPAWRGWRGRQSGRCARGLSLVLWLDALAQQALAADCIANIAAVLGEQTESDRWRTRHREHTELLNRHYWDEEDGIHYDIWEAYSPTEAKPSTHKRPDRFARPDFCGWSALGPISLMIENVIGLRCPDARERVLYWRPHQPGRHGVRHLRFGGVTASLIYDGHGGIEIESDHPFTLVTPNRRYDVRPGNPRLYPK